MCAWVSGQHQKCAHMRCAAKWGRAHRKRVVSCVCARGVPLGTRHRIRVAGAVCAFQPQSFPVRQHCSSDCGLELARFTLVDSSAASASDAERPGWHGARLLAGLCTTCTRRDRTRHTRTRRRWRRRRRRGCAALGGRGRWRKTVGRTPALVVLADNVGGSWCVGCAASRLVLHAVEVRVLLSEGRVPVPGRRHRHRDDTRRRVIRQSVAARRIFFAASLRVQHGRAGTGEAACGSCTPEHDA